jgi:hypothetical protein
MPEKPTTASGYPAGQVARVKSTCLWVANSCSRSDWQLKKPGAKELELLIFDHLPVLAPP